ncbi:MAG: hypothetical protein AAFZ15_26330 [Bacteroidota bacterium]
MKNNDTTRKKFLFPLITFCLTLLILWGLGEVAFRALLAFRSTGYPTAATVVHPKMGWTAKPNFNFSGTVTDAAGTDYDIQLAVDENGFKYFGDPASGKKKLLVVGDSYTHAIEVSNDKTYYGLLKDSLQNIELFAFGARGIGPLQQLIWLEEWHEKIQPDYILWQFCFNDVFNSSYELEHTSYFNNNRRPRPYLEQGETIFRNPARLGMGSLRKYSKFLDFTFTKIETFFESGDHKKEVASEDIIQKNGKEYVPYKEALEAVDLSLKKIKKLVGDETPILAFQTDVTEPFISDVRDIFEKNNIPVVKSAAEKIDKKIKNGETMLAKDLGHWNEAGHEITAEEIWPHLKEIIYPPVIFEDSISLNIK